jgi:hypothetical protein
MDHILPEFSFISERIVKNKYCSDEDIRLSHTYSSSSQSSSGETLTYSFGDPLSNAGAEALSREGLAPENNSLQCAIDQVLENTLEVRINRWLDEMGVVMVDPSDRQDDYFS